ncbi:MAG TPA: polyphosphate kinase 1 [Gemmatales bacterium]|nr:polyphosphate kinase 1 [Gemmatales bacterium]
MSQAATAAPTTDLNDPALYINRELSWLEFNRRVLEEATDPQVPLLERLKFIAIFSSNLEEFFMVRVGGLWQKIQAGILEGSGADRVPPREQLTQINGTVQKLTAEQFRCLTQEILPPLAKAGISIVEQADLGEEDQKHIRAFFHRHVAPVLTPLAIDPGHPFPHLSNKSLNVAVMLRRANHAEPLFAVVQVPGVLARFVPLPARSGHAFVALETVIRMHLQELFLGMELLHAAAFQVIRDHEFEIDEEVEDLLKHLEEELRKRKRGAAVHLYVESEAPSTLVQFLTAALDLEDQDVTLAPGMLDLTGLWQIYQLPGYPHLRDAHFVPRPSPDWVRGPNIWAAMRAKDVLVHHPYEAFAHVVEFIEHAAADPNVLAIKQTLYRTGADSPIIRALQRAAENGKQVTVLVELKARMDEERNIVWARELEKAGVHVVFGFVNLKTHCKVALVVRREEDSLRRYVHLATGNYNPFTARLYTDLGFFTCNEAFGEDVSALFNYLTGYSEVPQWRKLVVAPSRLQPFMINKIEQEAAHQAAGQGGRIIVKINGLLEPAIVQALYRASQAGVKIDIICRGICALRPGLPGISENIRVISIVDRFLEHSRIFYFANGGAPDVYIGSADWMDRNLSRRVEVVFPIEEPELKKRLIEEILAISLADNVKARLLFPDGHWERVPSDPENRVRSQERFLALAAEAAARIPAEPGILAPVSPEGVSQERNGERPKRPRRRASDHPKKAQS